MKRLCALAAALLLGLSRTWAADDLQTLAEARVGQVTAALTGEAAEIMNGVTVGTSGGLDAALSRLLEHAVQHADGILAASLRSLGKLLLVAVLCGILQGLRTAAGGGDLPVVTMAGALGMTGVLLTDLSGMMSLCRDTLAEISALSAGMLPVMAAAVSMTGAPAAAAALQGVTMFSFDLLVRFVEGVLLPAVGVYIALITINAAVGSGLLGQLANFVKWLVTGSMKLTLTLFIAYLTLSGIIGGSADAFAVKTAKFAVAGSVPVVGGIISDAAESMLAGAVLIRSTVGITGMLAVAAICLLPFLRVGCNYLVFQAGSAVIAPVCGPTLAGLVAGLGDSLGLILGMLGTCSAILFFELVFSITLVHPI